MTTDEQALRDELEFLLASIDDLEREREAGDVDEEDHRRLLDGYTARAARIARLAFYGLLAIFPAIAAAIAIWGLVADPAQIVEQIDGLTRSLPPEAAEIIHDQAASAASSEGGALVTAILAILIGIFSASKGIKSLTEGNSKRK